MSVVQPTRPDRLPRWASLLRDGCELDTLRRGKPSFSFTPPPSLPLNLVQELGEVTELAREVISLRLSLLVVHFPARATPLVDCMQLAAELDYFVCLLLLLRFVLGDALVKLRHAVLGLELLTHGERYGTRRKFKIGHLAG